MTTGDRMRARRKSLKISAEYVAERLGVSPATVYRYEKGDIEKVPGDLLEPISRILHTTPAYLMGWEEAAPLPSNILSMPGLKKVPRLGAIACGEPILAEQNIEDYDSVPAWVKCDFTLVCKGDSMTGARIFDGDIVCVKRQEAVENGQIAAVLVEGEFDSEATLKRFYKKGDTISLVAENPAYPPLIFVGEDTNRVRVIGIATHFISAIR